MKSFEIFDIPRKAYKRMLEDISSAKTCICLETYIYDNDEVGRRFRKELIKKAREGVVVRVLVDAWGSTADKEFFEELVEAGAEVKFFREFRYVIRMFTKNHERNHRKLLLIDNYVSYVGSANITASSLDWWELIVRMGGEISEHLRHSFNQSWEQSGKITSKRIRKIIHEGFEIIQDIPSEKHKSTEKRYIELINHAKREILIETPYFIPSLKVRNAFLRAVKRGVEIKLILPYYSDVRVVDVMRNIYLGRLYKGGIKIFYYMPATLHSKLIIVDNNFFILGSSNLDYRSFLHQYEINLLGRDKQLVLALKEHFRKTLRGCDLFDYWEWKRRSSFLKIFELFLYRFKRYF